MKFIKEGIINGAISLETLFSMVYGGVHNSDRYWTYDFRIHNFLLFSEQARMELIKLVLSTDKTEILEKYLDNILNIAQNGADKRALKDWNNDPDEIKRATCLDPDFTELFGQNPRLVLINEFLLWYKCGVRLRKIPDMCFYLIYREKSLNEDDVFDGYSKFWIYPEELRKETLKICYSFNKSFYNFGWPSDYIFWISTVTKKKCEEYSTKWGVDSPAWIVVQELMRWTLWCPKSKFSPVEIAVTFAAFVKQTPFAEVLSKLENTEFAIKSYPLPSIKRFLSLPEYSGSLTSDEQKQIITALKKHLHK